MGEPDSDPSEQGGADADPPLTVELLADLQAGLLDDEAAAQVRKRVRADPAAEGILRALNQVRHDVADVGADPASVSEALEPAPAVISRISAALRSASPNASPQPAHSARPRIRPARVIAGVAGLCAVVAAIGVGTAALLNLPAPTPSTEATAEHITVSRPASEPALVIPLSQPQILGLLDHRPDFGPPGGPLEDPPRRASCLRGLGYPPSVAVLGARPIEVNSRPAVLLVLPGDTPNDLAVFAVALNCSAVDTGLMASTQVPRSH
jgi:hypothetical protein